MLRGIGLTKRREISIEDVSERDVETCKIDTRGWDMWLGQDIKGFYVFSTSMITTNSLKRTDIDN